MVATVELGSAVVVMLAALAEGIKEEDDRCKEVLPVAYSESLPGR